MDRDAERPVIGVVGLGTMGLGIAQVFAQAGFPVLATDARPEARDDAAGRIGGAISERVQAGKMDGTDATATLRRLTVVPGPDALGRAAMVVEAIAERIEAKRALFARLERVADTGAVLATNTSSLPVGGIAEGLVRPERVVGLHFFNPAPAMKLVELVGHAGTSAEALAFARRVTEATGKTVIAAPDRPGFIVNRCARPFYGEALAMLEEGRGAAEIDAAMVAAGYRLGPFALIDLIGADINLATTGELSAAMGGHPRYHVFAALEAQVTKGRLGRKTGSGFVFPHSPAAPPADWQAIALRLEATLANEAAWLLSEGGVTADGIDTAMKLGLNFPRGPFESAREHGVGKVLDALAKLEAAAPAHLKGRYVAAPALEAMG